MYPVFLKPRIKWKNVCILEGIIILILVVLLCFRSSASESISYPAQTMTRQQFMEFLAPKIRCVPTQTIIYGMWNIHTYTEPKVEIKGKPIDYTLTMNYIPTDPREIQNSISLYYYNNYNNFLVIQYQDKYIVNAW